MHHLRLMLLLLVAGCLVLVACAAEERDPGSPRSAPSPSSSSISAPSAPTTPSRSATTPTRSPVASSFAFAAAGDHGANRHTAAMLRALDGSDAAFYVALGDLDYDETPSDAAWCGFVHRGLPRKGSSYPFELVVGNHEMDGGPDGRIARFARCLPDRMSSDTSGGAYAAQYSFDYPRTDPLLRFIAIAPEITASGRTYHYGPGAPDRRWLVDRIRTAREQGIRWVVVGLHYPCISSGASHGCDSGPSVMNLLVDQHVDLVLAGHNHIYERSKQLALGPGCAVVRPESYDAACVVDPGADGTYTAGRGTVQVTAGAVHGGEKGVDPADGDVPYFATTDDTSTGFVHYAVTPTRLTGRWVGTSGSFADTFTIQAP